MKAKLIKKDSPLQEELKQARKSRKLRKKAATARSAFEITTDWLMKSRHEETGNAREAFAALFSNTDPQSA
ncbi:MAG: hypothetical protein M3X11_23440 [Acidobacteriota bacterium]|nr:hypothetical protein [Acidobacteriota bacterium]